MRRTGPRYPAGNGISVLARTGCASWRIPDFAPDKWKASSQNSSTQSAFIFEIEPIAILNNFILKRLRQTARRNDFSTGTPSAVETWHKGVEDGF